MLQTIVKTLCRMLLLGIWVVGAHAADVVVPGIYVLSGGAGRLKIEERGGTMHFSVDSVGGNCHTCGLSGKLTGLMAETPEEPAGATVCQILMTPSSDGRQITVEPQTVEVCRQYCGMRAGFDGTYRKPQFLCTKREQQAARDRFIAHYHDEQFPDAVEALRPVVEQCGEFLSGLDADRVRNDLSLAYFHAGQPKQCVEVLRGTMGATFETEQALRQGLPPCDFDNYLSVAQATWHNMQLCVGPH